MFVNLINLAELVKKKATHCEKSGVPNLIRPEACGRHDRETVTQVYGQ